MRSIAQCLPLAVLATLVNACERPTAPTSRPASVLVERSPNASISDAVNGGRLGFYFLPSLVANPGASDATFDATLAPYATICALVNEIVGCGDGDNLMTFPFGGAGPTGITVNALSESYNANWNKPTLGIGKYRLSVNVTATVVDVTRQIGLGFVDLQVISQKKDPVDAGFVPVVKGSPIPVKFRIETGTVGGIRVGGVAGVLVVGTREVIRVSVFDLKGQAMPCPGLTWTSSNPAVVSINATNGVFEALGVGQATITVTCLGVSGSTVLNVFPLPVPD